MEFWLDIMELFCTPGDSVYCIFGRSKTMHAANVSFPFNIAYMNCSKLIYNVNVCVDAKPQVLRSCA
jgi:hypothetical protein